jgi:hypothetical protein
VTQGNPPPAQYPQMSTQAQSPQTQRAMAIAILRRRVKTGANSFYFVAALSVINSIISAIGFNLTFVFGLSITQIIDGAGVGLGDNRPDLALAGKIGAVIVSVIISGVFALFGLLGGQGRRWAFIVGMVLYLLDGILMLAALLWLGTGQFQDWIGFAIHFYFLWSMWRGLQAATQLQKLLAAPAPVGSNLDFPKDIGVS